MIVNLNFQMDSIHICSQLMTPRFIASIDLRDTYYSLPIAKELQKYLKFVWQGNLYQFKCLAQGLSSALPSLHQTYETCVFVPQGVGTYLKWLPWWLLLIRILPWRVPSQHWWYPNPASPFGFLASLSQISNNTNPGLASPRVYFKLSGYENIQFGR